MWTILGGALEFLLIKLHYKILSLTIIIKVLLHNPKTSISLESESELCGKQVFLACTASKKTTMRHVYIYSQIYNNNTNASGEERRDFISLRCSKWLDMSVAKTMSITRALTCE